MSLKNFVASVAVVAMAFISVGNTHADTFTYTGGSLNDGDSYLADDGSGATGLPGIGQTGFVNINATFLGTSNAGLFAPTGSIVFGGGSTLTASIDIVANNPSSLVFNDVTANVGDDIFSGTGNFIFNAGSATNVDDDFQANAGGTITVNGGTHTLGLAPTGTANFGAQNGSTLNFLGGTVTGADLFQTGNASSSLTIDGSASIDTEAVSFFAGTVDFGSTWTGFIDNAASSSLGDFESLLVSSGATLDGAAIDSAVFNSNFELNGAGALILTPTAVPEPSSVALIGLAGLGLMIRRRK